jgi:hypothetical protein
MAARKRPMGGTHAILLAAPNQIPSEGQRVPYPQTGGGHS